MKESRPKCPKCGGKGSSLYLLERFANWCDGCVWEAQWNTGGVSRSSAKRRRVTKAAESVNRQRG